MVQIAVFAQTKLQKYCDVFAGIRLIEMGKSGKQFHFHTDDDGNDVGYSLGNVQPMYTL